ncbi:maleylpyruvate isomerase N-terminal domain-containing protein [Nonomuraea sp. B19D2]|uniref:maleylpyruvate isomerase N-terminal domain-containing protein n=1 Tax=Nonomuraea sp. B19D2 TaxID=3159561 RepID=UPI0032DAE6C3
MTVLPALQAEPTSATGQLPATAASLSDADLAAPSLLPGWTRGHVLAHLRLERRLPHQPPHLGEDEVKIPQYTSCQARAAAIEAVPMVALARGSAGHASSGTVRPARTPRLQRMPATRPQHGERGRTQERLRRHHRQVARPRPRPRRSRARPPTCRPG